jgi:GxxExxY protein
VPLPVDYKGIHVDCGYRIDLVVEDRTLLELKAVDRLLPIHEAQAITYLRLGRFVVGLLVHFNVPVLRTAIRRLRDCPETECPGWRRGARRARREEGA